MTSAARASQLRDVGSGRATFTESNRRPVLAAAIAVHILFLLSPLDVLAPVDAHDLGRRVLGGDLPYIDFGFEYPPLAIVPMLLAGVVPHAWGPSALAAQAIALEAALVVYVLRHHEGAVLRYALASVFVFPLLSGGVDAPVLAGVTIATHMLARRNGTGWLVAGFVIPVKLATASVWVWARHRLRVGITVGIAATSLALLPVIAVGSSPDSWVGYTLKRGVQAESVGASVHWISELFAGNEVEFVYRFRSWEVIGGRSASLVVTVLALGAVVALAVRCSRRPVDPWLASYAVMMVALVGNKVFSPQFIAWGVGIAAVLGGRWFAAHLALSATTLVILQIGGDLGDLSPLIAGRNLTVVLVAVAALVAAWRSVDVMGPNPWSHPPDNVTT